MTHRPSPFAVLTVWLLAVACSRAAQPGPEALAPAAAESTAVPESAAVAAAPAAPDTTVFLPGPAVPPLQLSVRAKAAQLVMPWIGGEYWATDAAATAAALDLVRAGVGGFIVGPGASPYDVAEKLNLLQRASRLPLLIAADLESGPGMRFHGGAVFPGNMALGATDRELDAYEVGRVTALEARAVGIQLDFAPVVDVNNNPANPIINVRSFGENPQRVARLAEAFIRGLREHGMLSTAKHFPGHGNTGTDSHIALPLITASRAELDSVELVPFRAAIRAGTDAVMTAHIALAGLAGSGAAPIPATLSPLVLDTLLRGELGFEGVVVTDALNMSAIVSAYGAAQAAVLALKAGADLLLMPADPAGAIDAIVDAVARGDVSEARLDSSVARVLALKARAGLFQHRLVDINRIASAVGTGADLALAQDIAQRSLVLVRDTAGLVPLAARRRLLLVTYGDESFRDVGGALAAALRAAGDTVQAMRLWPASGPASFDSVRTAAASAGTVLFAAASQPTAWRPDAVDIPAGVAGVVEELAQRGLPIVAISFGSPYVIARIPDVRAYLAAWSDNLFTERAVAQALLGAAPITGRLPVTLPPPPSSGFPIGTGLQRGMPAGAPDAGRAAGHR